MDNNVLKDLTQIFRDVFSNSKLEITPQLNSRDVEKWDSLAHLIMIKEVEAHFKIKFKLIEMASIQNAGDLINLIENKLENQ